MPRRSSEVGENIRFVEESTKVIITECSSQTNNFCLEEGRYIVKRLANLVGRCNNRLVLEVPPTKKRNITYNSVSFCCPRLELNTLQNGYKELIITDGNNTQRISARDRILSLRNIYHYAIGDLS